MEPPDCSISESLKAMELFLDTSCKLALSYQPLIHVQSVPKQTTCPSQGAMVFQSPMPSYMLLNLNKLNWLTHTFIIHFSSQTPYLTLTLSCTQSSWTLHALLPRPKSTEHPLHYAGVRPWMTTVVGQTSPHSVNSKARNIFSCLGHDKSSVKV